MKKFIRLSFLILAIGLGFLTRFYKLGEAPSGLYLDEAAQGYNAYSIAKTGKDEFGKAFPIVFRSFTDFKTPVYIYLIIPLIPIFDLTKFTVRLPSFIFSVFTFPFLFFLLKKISPKNISKEVASITTVLLAISPWHVLFGRTNFEVNVSVFFLIAGLFFFYQVLGPVINPRSDPKPKLLVLSAIFFAITIPAYHSQRLVVPILLAYLFFKFKKTFLSSTFKKSFVLAILVGLLVSLPTLSVITTQGFLARATGLNIFSSEKKPYGFMQNYNGFLGTLVNNRIFLSTKEFASLYVSYFSPRNMFILGDSGPRSSYPELSTYFLWQFPFYLYGLYTVLKKKELGELRNITLTLLLISPIPAAVTRDPYSTIRSLNLVIPQLIIISLGLLVFYKNTKRLFKKRFPIIFFAFKPTVVFLTIITLSFSLIKLWSSAIVLNEYLRVEYWNYGWEEVAKTIQTLDQSLPIIVDNARSEPYSQLIFFLKYDPEKYQRENFEAELKNYYTDMKRNTTKKIGNITTRKIDWEKDLLTRQYLIGDALSISNQQINEHNLELIKDVLYPDRSIAFRIVKTNI